jgi:hypothetical protein
MPSVGFEATISAGERPHTHALDRDYWDRQWENNVFIFFPKIIGSSAVISEEI